MYCWLQPYYAKKHIYILKLPLLLLSAWSMKWTNVPDTSPAPTCSLPKLYHHVITQSDTVTLSKDKTFVLSDLGMSGTGSEFNLMCYSHIHLSAFII